MNKISKLIRFYSKLIKLSTANPINFKDSVRDFRENKKFLESIIYRGKSAFEIIDNFLNKNYQYVSDDKFICCVLAHEINQYNVYVNKFAKKMIDLPNRGEFNPIKFFRNPKENEIFLESYFEGFFSERNLKTRIRDFYREYLKYSQSEMEYMHVDEHTGKIDDPNVLSRATVSRATFLFVMATISTIKKYYKERGIDFSSESYDTVTESLSKILDSELRHVDCIRWFENCSNLIKMSNYAASKSKLELIEDEDKRNRIVNMFRNIANFMEFMKPFVLEINLLNEIKKNLDVIEEQETRRLASSSLVLLGMNMENRLRNMGFHGAPNVTGPGIDDGATGRVYFSRFMGRKIKK